MLSSLRVFIPIIIVPPPMLSVSPSWSSNLVERVGHHHTGHGTPPWLVGLGWIALLWYIIVVAICALGYFQM